MTMFLASWDKCIYGNMAKSGLICVRLATLLEGNVEMHLEGFHKAVHARIVKFLYIPYRWKRLSNLLPENVMGFLKILTQKCACGRSFVMIIWKPLSIGSYFCKNNRRTERCRSLYELVQVIVCTLILYICSTIQSCTLYPRERAAVNVPTVCLSRIENLTTIKNFICKCLYDCGCDAVEDYIFLRDL